MKKILTICLLVVSITSYSQLDITKRKVTATENFYVRSDTVPNMTEVNAAISTAESNNVEWEDTTNYIATKQDIYDTISLQDALLQGIDSIKIGSFMIIANTDSLWIDSSGVWYCSIKQFQEVSAGVFDGIHNTISGSTEINLYDGSDNSAITKIVSRSQYDSIFMTINSRYNGGSETTVNEFKVGNKSNVMLKVYGSEGSVGEVSVPGRLFVGDYIKTTQLSGSLTDGAPTDSEIVAISGFSPLQGAGVSFTIKDTDGSSLLYKIESDGTDWYYTVMTKAL